MRSYNVVLLRGDGIGSEVIDEAVKVLNKTSSKYNFNINYSEGYIGGVAIEKYGRSLPKDTIIKCKQADSVLLGAVGGYKWDNLLQAIRPEMALLELRNELGLFANICYINIFEDIYNTNRPKDNSNHKNLDLTIVRELLGGVYLKERSYIKSNGVCASYDTEIYMEEEIERVARLAFEVSMKENQKLVNVDKANVLESSKTWRNCVLEVGKQYPNINLSHMSLDECSRQLLEDPSELNVLLASNMFGGILIDLVKKISGNSNMLASASLGENGFGLYEPLHGSAPDIQGKGIANPIGMILSASLMLKYSFNELEAANDIINSVRNIIKEARTIDITKPGIKTVFCSEMGNLISNRI